ncbi:LysR family transcriptional regulator [Amylibacter marinus]|uniref:LysR family transcriptional regulator n=1 Tax=Amylibacter marinus TaxID=1475483 RepID=A0ABQ5VWJ9_9RHOB|nr:LysR family transcriptional regulator [Amylibacter marinus]GLQ35579.1 LysR family transcriptional regulator [Amylibacter marinus]
MVDIRDMEMLIALAQHQHFSLAADQCGVSQPAFSARIRKIESDLGLSIVRRGNKFQDFTREGELLLKWSRKILADVQGMHQDLEIAKGQLRGKLVIGAVPTSLPFVAGAAADLRDEYPDLMVEIHSMSSQQIAKGLNDFRLDAGIIYVGADVGLNAALEPLYDEQYFLTAPKGMVDPERHEITWDEAAKLPLCLLTRNMRNRQIIDAAFQSIGAAPEPVAETSGFTAAVSLVARGAVATITPKSIAQSMFSHADVVHLPLVGPRLSHSIGLAVQEHDPALPALDALRRVIKASI